jgi:hypothetical protein
VDVIINAIKATRGVIGSQPGADCATDSSDLGQRMTQPAISELLMVFIFIFSSLRND